MASSMDLPMVEVLDDKDLCDFCISIDLKVAGYYQEDFPWEYWNRGFLVEPEENEEDEEDYDRVEDLAQILTSSCPLCSRMAICWRIWCRLNPQSLNITSIRRSVHTSFESSLEVDEDGEPLGRYVDTSIMLLIKRPPPDGSLYGPELHFRKCSAQPVHVSNFCHNAKSLTDWTSPCEQPYSSRLRPLVADSRLFQKWKHTCSEQHGTRCADLFSGGKLPRLRLIDVENYCVIETENEHSYVALSYVWGKVQVPLLTKATERQYGQFGSLKSELIPATIADAMEVTRVLGEKFLWVDSICIVQDDPADKASYISKMDAIYGSASVTVIAAFGDTAQAGLPGVRPSSRLFIQEPFIKDGTTFIPSFSTGGTSYIGDNSWDTRGWTFQETLFSSRKLIFTAEQIYWECQSAFWCEDGYRELINKPVMVRRQKLNSNKNVYLSQLPWRPEDNEFESLYRSLVEEFSQRDLTYEDDVLRAFGGIFNALNRDCNQEFLWGLPISFLGPALSWPRGKRRRVTSVSTVSENGTKIPIIFPSWTWAGWIGDEIPWTQFDLPLNKNRLDLKFYILEQTGKPQLLHTARPHDVTGDELEYSQVLRGDSAKIVVDRRDIPSNVLALSNSGKLLCFWASTAIIKIRCSCNDESKELALELICDEKIMKARWHQIPDFKEGQEELAEFVVTSIQESQEYSVYALLVSYEGDVAYRRGLIHVKPSEWLSLNHRVWKLVILG